MKYTAFWLTLAACCAFSAGSVLAQGAGQGQHEVGSGAGNPSTPAGGGQGDHVGQAKNGPNGSLGAPVQSGVHNDSAGQGKQEAGGSGGGNNEVTPRTPIVTRPGPQQLVTPESGRMNNATDWRFVYSNGMWWYYQPDNSWTYYQNGSWQNYDEPRTARMDREHENMHDRDSVHHDAAHDNANHENANHENANNSKSVEKH